MINRVGSAYPNPYLATAAAGKRKAEGAAGDTQQFMAEVQARSAEENQAAADSQARNATAIADMARQGISMTLHTYTGDYKNAALAKVDTDGDASISALELTRQVEAGGGNAAQVAALYAAMDMDSDGNLSGQEFKDSIPDPFGSAAFSSKLNRLAAAGPDGTAATPSMIGDLFRQQAEQSNISAVLGDLAGRLAADGRDS